MTGFHEVRLPMRLALGATGGPECRTEIIALASGHEVRNAKWRQSRRRWEIGGAVSGLADLQTLTQFFEARCGRLYGFRFRDPLDHSSALPGQPPTSDDQVIGIGTGAIDTFQLVRQTGDDQRVICKPVEATVRVALDGVELISGWQVDPTSGRVVFDATPAAGIIVSAGFEYDCPVRFDRDHIETVLDAFDAGRVVSLGVVEVMGPAG